MADLTARMILELVDRLSGPAKVAARRMGALTRSATNMAKSFERLNEGGRRARKTIRQLGADAKKLPSGAGVGRAARAVGAGDVTGRGRDPHRIWGRGTMAQAGRDMSRFGRMSLGAMSSTLRIFADFDQKMGDVAAVTRGITKKEFEAIRLKAREIGEATKFTATEAASAFEMLGMASLDAATQLKVIDHVMNLSAAGAMGLSQTTDIATDVMMGFNLEAEDMGRIANVLAVGATSATTTIAGLGKGLSKVAPVSAQLGISLEETTAFLAAFANMGLKGGIGGRSLRRILISLVAPSSRARKEFENLKVEVVDADKKMRRPVEIFQDMTVALRKLPEAERIKKLHRIFQAFGMVGAAGAVGQFNKAIGKTPKEAEKLNDIIKILNRAMDADGQAAAMAGRRMDTMRGDSLKLKSALQGAAITIGEEFNEELRQLIRDVTQVVRDFGRWAKENSTLVKGLIKTWAAVAVLAAVFGPLIVAVDTFVKLLLIIKSIEAASMFSGIGIAMGRAGAMAGKMGAGLGKTIGLLRTPAGLVTGGILAGVTAIVMKTRSEMEKLKATSESLAADIRSWIPETVKAQTTAQLGKRAEVLTGRVAKEEERVGRAKSEGWGWIDRLLGTTVDTTALEGLQAELRQTREAIEKRTGGMGAEFTGPTQEMVGLKIKVESDVPVKTKVELENVPENVRALIENLGLQGAGG